MAEEIDTVRATPLQTLQCSTGLLQKDVEVAIPRGEAELWASMKPPLVKIATPTLAKGK